MSMRLRWIHSLEISEKDQDLLITQVIHNVHEVKVDPFLLVLQEMSCYPWGAAPLTRCKNTRKR